MSIIQTKNLTFSYDEDFVLKGIDLNIKKGEFVAILGHNGSGKSTIAKHFNAINLPKGGKVYVCGFDTADEGKVFEIRKRAGMVFQNPDNQMVAALVEDEVAFAPENLGINPKEIRRRVNKSLAAVGLSGYEMRTAANLSGGEKQRVAIAAVLAMEPEIIILDEATAMLDPKGRSEVMSAILQINKNSSTTVVHITHHMEEAALSDRVIVMDEGKILLDGTPHEVFYEAELLKSVGLDVPQMTRLAYELRRCGVDIPCDIITVEEMYNALMHIRK